MSHQNLVITLILLALVSSCIAGIAPKLKDKGKEPECVEGDIQSLQKCVKHNPKNANLYISLGNALRDAGESRYREALNAFNRGLKLLKMQNRAGFDVAKVHFFIGTVHHLMRRYSTALKHYDLALEYSPTFWAALNNAALALKDDGAPTAAILSMLERSIKINRENHDTFYIRGNVLREAGRFAEAALSYKLSLNIKETADSWNNLGNVLKEMDTIDDSGNENDVTPYDCFKKGCSLSGNPYYCLNYARELPKDESIAFLKGVLEHHPTHYETMNEIGSMLKDMGDASGAIEWYDRALGVLESLLSEHHVDKESIANAQLKRAKAGFITNKAGVYLDLHDYSHALALLRRAVEIAPDLHVAVTMLGNALHSIGQYEEAVQIFKQSLDLHLQQQSPNTRSSDVVEILNNLGASLFEIKSESEKETGGWDGVIKAYERALSINPAACTPLSQLIFMHYRLFIWGANVTYHSQLVDRMKQKLKGKFKNELDCIAPLSGIVYEWVSPKKLLEISTAASLAVETKSGNVNHPKGIINFKASTHILRIGFLSSDLREHAVGRQIQHVMCKLSHADVKIYAFSTAPPDDSSIRSRIKGCVDVWRELADISDGDAADLIRNDGIDILIDLNGHTANARHGILARRPAPISVNFLGFPGTSGARYMDYIITDRWSSPPHLRKYLSEALLYMPHTYQVNEHAASFPFHTVIGLDNDNLGDIHDNDNDQFVVASFNQIWKVTPSTFESWMRIMKRAPNIVFWTLRNPIPAVSGIKDAFSRHNISESRLILADMLPKKEHLQRIRKANLHIDTFGYNAHTVAMDALWMGVPTVTMPMKKMASRVGASLVAAVDEYELVDHLVMDSRQAYEDKIVELATDKSYYGEVKSRLESRVRGSGSNLFDMDDWSLHFLQAMRIMANCNQRAASRGWHVIVSTRHYSTIHHD